MKTSAAIAAAFAGVAAATSWNDFPSFKTPSNNDNQCDSQEQSGWSWGNLGTGSFSSYGGFNFNGWTCANSFGKRDPLSKRDFQSKCIQGSMSAGQGPSFSCGQGSDFSIDQYQISVSKDTDVEFHYSMPDGTTCKQTASCKSGGTVVQNSQCGGAKQVSFQLPQGSSGGCDIGIHSIGFDCSGPPPSSSSSAPPSSSKPTTSPTSSSPAAPPTSSTPHTSPPSSSSSQPAPTTSSTQAPPTSSSQAPPPTSQTAPPTSYSTQTPPTSSPPHYGNSSQPAPPPTSQTQPPPTSQQGPPPSSSLPTTPPSSSLAAPPTSSSPVSSSSTPALPTTSSTTTTSPATTPTTTTPATTAPTTTSSTSSSPPPNGQCPDVLPQCLSTWIHQSDCQDNSDYTCYCKNSDFTKNVIDCVTAYGADTTTISQALSYLQGICAMYIPQNPGLITNCPSSIPISVPPVSTPTATLVASDTTTYTTQIITHTIETCTPGQTITDNSVTTVLSKATTRTVTISSTATITTCTKCNGGGGSGGGAQATQAPQYTTVTIGNTYTVPCTFTEGVSQGFPIPGSSTITRLTTQVTVPWVQFTTASAAAAGSSTVSVGLAQGPAPGAGGYTGGAGGGAAPSTTTAGAVGASGVGGGATGGYGSMVTTFQPTGFGSSTTSGGSAPSQVTTNAAPKATAGAVLGLMAGGALAILAL